MKKSVRVSRIILQIIVSLMFLFAGFAKVSRNSMEVSMFSTVHLDSTLVIIGIIEILIALMLWWKKTRTLAVLLATAVLGAAFAETISLGMPGEVLAPGILLLLVWAIFALDRYSCSCSCGACKNCTGKNSPQNIQQ